MQTVESILYSFLVNWNSINELIVFWEILPYTEADEELHLSCVCVVRMELEQGDD